VVIIEIDNFNDDVGLEIKGSIKRGYVGGRGGGCKLRTQNPNWNNGCKTKIV
jgi:hypothetical protein